MNITLFHKIMDQLKVKNLNLTQLANKSGIHISEMSRILNHRQSLSLRNLDAITAALELEEGIFYSNYIEDCFNENGFFDKRRSMQFLYKCVADGYKEPLRMILEIVVEERSKSILTKNLGLIFTVAETLFEEGKEHQALPLYETIIESMPNHNLSQLAISYYRKFRIVRLTPDGYRAAVNLLKYIPYLTKELQLSTYLWFIATGYFRNNWKKVMYYAKILEELAKEGDYYGRALLYQGFALTRLDGSLNEVLSIIERYSKVNDYYADLAVGNRFVTYLEYGHYEHVDDYLNWLKGRDDLFAGLPRVLEVYVILGRLEDAKNLFIEYRHVFENIEGSKEPYKQLMHLHFRFAHAMYQCSQYKFNEGLHEILDIAAKANELGIMKRFKQCLLIFWKYKNRMNSDHERKYLQLLGIKGIYSNQS